MKWILLSAILFVPSCNFFKTLGRATVECAKESISPQIYQRTAQALREGDSAVASLISEIGHVVVCVIRNMAAWRSDSEFVVGMSELGPRRYGLDAQHKFDSELAQDWLSRHGEYK